MQMQMQVYLEVFLTRIGNEAIIYCREYQNISEKRANPDELVRELVQKKFGLELDQPDLLIHSTSWRYLSEGGIVLTYLVYSAGLDFRTKAIYWLEASDLIIASSPDPTHPSPARVSELNVFSHGLRHLSFLLEQDKTLREKLISQFSPELLEIFRLIGAGLAGNIDTEKVS